jgi:hypothetical protein
MGYGINKVTIADVNFNLYDVTSFYVDEDSLIINFSSHTLIFNQPEDIADVASTFSELTTKYDALQASWEGYQSN